MGSGGRFLTFCTFVMLSLGVPKQKLMRFSANVLLCSCRGLSMSNGEIITYRSGDRVSKISVRNKVRLPFFSDDEPFLPNPNPAALLEIVEGSVYPTS